MRPFLYFVEKMEGECEQMKKSANELKKGLKKEFEGNTMSISGNYF